MKALSSLDGVVSVKASWKNKNATVTVKKGTEFNTKIADDAIGKDYPISNVEVLAVN